MDWITHSAAGASIAWAWPRRWAVPKAAPIAVAAALLSDLDYFIEPFLDPRSDFAHRGFTHSPFGVAVLAPVIALVPLWLSKEKRSSARYARLVALIAAGILSHVVLDLLTELGGKVFYPFSRKTVYLDWLSPLDFTLFTLSLFVLLAAWTYATHEAALRRGILSSALLAAVSWFLFAPLPMAFYASDRWGPTKEPFSTVYPPFTPVYPLILGGVLLGLFAAFARKGWGFRQNRAVFGRIGLAAFSIYLLVCGAAQGLALTRIEQFTRERGIEVLARAATRLEPWSFVGPLRWTGLVLAPDGVYKAQVSPFGARSPTLRFFPSAPGNAFIARARSLPRVQAFLSAARFPVSCYQVEGNQHIVEFYDHGLGEGVGRVALNERLETVEIRGIAIWDYLSGTSPSQTALQPTEVDPDVAPQVASDRPCFFH